MDQSAKDRIGATFRANITRVRNLVAAYDSLGTPGAGRPSVQQTDVLRAAVVLLHASLEDLMRTSSEELLPHATVEVLNRIGFKRGRGISLTVHLPKPTVEMWVGVSSTLA